MKPFLTVISLTALIIGPGCGNESAPSPADAVPAPPAAPVFSDGQSGPELSVPLSEPGESPGEAPVESSEPTESKTPGE